jgi:signal transduction histidine kinase
LLDAVALEWRVRAEQRSASLNVADGSSAAVRGDRYILRRVFANLVGNALRHAGDRIAIELTATPIAEIDAVRFTVRDNGAGIPAAYHELIFDKFGGVARGGNPPTSGLGLTFCKLAVEAHGGRIWVESGERGGTAFHFVIPLDPGSLSDVTT